MSRQSRASLGRGVRAARVTGTMTRIAIARRIAAKLTGGTSRTPILMNSQTVLQMRHVMIQTIATREGMKGGQRTTVMLKSAPCAE